MKSMVLVSVTSLLVLLSAFAIGESANEREEQSSSSLDQLQSTQNLIVYQPAGQQRIFAYSAITGDSWKLELDEKLDHKMKPVVSSNLVVVATAESVFAFSARHAEWVELPESHSGSIDDIRVVNDVAQVAFEEEVWFFSSHANRWSGLSLKDGVPYEVEEKYGAIK